VDPQAAQGALGGGRGSQGSQGWQEGVVVALGPAVCKNGSMDLFYSFGHQPKHKSWSWNTKERSSIAMLASASVTLQYYRKLHTNIKFSTL
jgi:hypothetical protein